MWHYLSNDDRDLIRAALNLSLVVEERTALRNPTKEAVRQARMHRLRTLADRLLRGGSKSIGDQNSLPTVRDVVSMHDPDPRVYAAVRRMIERKWVDWEDPIDAFAKLKASALLTLPNFSNESLWKLDNMVGLYGVRIDHDVKGRQRR